MLKTMLVSQNRQHPLQTFVREFYYPATAFTDQVLVVRLPRHRLIPLEALTKVMGSDQPALEKKLKCAVHSGGTHPLALQLQFFSNGFYRQVLVRMKHDLRDEIPLARDRLMVLPEMTAKAFGVSGSLPFIQSGHRPVHPWELEGTRTRVARR